MGEPMILGVDSLRTEPGLLELLLRYGARHKESPQTEWHDRVMELDGADGPRLAKLHGLLLAAGWIETRVHGESFRTPGRLEACYRITPEGLTALRSSASGQGEPASDDLLVENLPPQA